jgi:hypothetical protein
VLLDPGWTHITYSPTLLLIVSSLYSLATIAVLVSARRLLVARVHASRALLPALFVVLSPLPIVFIAREHVPVLGSLPFLPHASFCFGNPGALHVIAFALPIISTLVALRIINGPARPVLSAARP